MYQKVLPIYYYKPSKIIFISLHNPLVLILKPVSILLASHGVPFPSSGDPARNCQSKTNTILPVLLPSFKMLKVVGNEN
jgi:hypothetical protein